jgi:hypothetical protein
VTKIKTDHQNKIQIGKPEVHTEKIRMPIFKCSCGENILIVPDLPEMDKAIRAHMIEHKRVTGEPLKEEIIVQLILKTITEYQV